LGKKVWECELDIYGKVRNLQGDQGFIPFRYQGQYEDQETGLYYNRFRYYSPEEGLYLSQDPIRLLGGDKFYGYVHDPNGWVDVLGLAGFTPVPFNGISFRGIKEGQPLLSPTNRDIAHYTKTGTMPGISTFDSPNTIWATSDKFKLNMTEAAEIDTKNLGPNLEAVLDSANGHVSIQPSETYLKKNNLSMIDALNDWMKGGEDHILSQDLKKSIKGIKCRS
jgi:RHS repeat-associated protein